MSTLSGKTALVTGASCGIGRASALALAAAGAQVLVHYGRGANEADGVVGEIRKAGGRAGTGARNLQPILVIRRGDRLVRGVTSLQHPEWTPIFDYDPARAINSRKAILDRVATDGIMAMGYHFPFPAIGHVVRHDKAYRWEAVHWAW